MNQALWSVVGRWGVDQWLRPINSRIHFRRNVRFLASKFPEKPLLRKIRAKDHWKTELSFGLFASPTFKVDWLKKCQRVHQESPTDYPAQTCVSFVTVDGLRCIPSVQSAIRSSQTGWTSSKRHMATDQVPVTIKTSFVRFLSQTPFQRMAVNCCAHNGQKCLPWPV